MRAPGVSTFVREFTHIMPLYLIKKELLIMEDTKNFKKLFLQNLVDCVNQSAQCREAEFLEVIGTKVL
jgi:hypothetical protein